MAAPPTGAGISVRYLGWKPTGGTQGDQFIEPALRDLLDKSPKGPNSRLKRHWLEFGGGQLRITEFAADDGRSGLASSCRYPEIPLSDISSVKIDSVDRLAFGMILIGYNEESTCSVHVHAWRGSTAAEVASFASRLDAAVRPARQPRDKYCQHQHQPQPQPQQRHPAAAGTPFAAAPAAAVEASLGSLAHTLAQELRQRLDSGNAAPLLHPPRDYDTLRRSHGNVRLRCSVQQLAASSRAPNGAYIRRKSVISSATEHALGNSAGDPADEPLPDYDTGDTDADAGNTARNSASSSSLSQGDDSRWSDPWLGFSTWRQQSDLD